MSTSSIVFIEHFNLSEEQFKYLFSINAIVNIVVSLLIPKLLNYIKADKIIFMGMTFVVTSGVLLLLFSQYKSVESYIIPVMIGTIGFAIIIGICTGKALAPFKTTAGTAALLGFIQMSGSSIIVMIIQALSFSAVMQLSLFAFSFIPLIFLKQISHRNNLAMSKN